jgi:branched-chain amino acid transport system permease protein
LRIRGVQLAVVTLTAVTALEEFLFKNESIMGAGGRISSPVPRPSYFTLDVGFHDTEDRNTADRWQFVAFALIVATLIGLAVANLRRGQTGRRFLAVRANERAAAATGIDVARTKMLGFAISSAIAGIGGVLVAYKFGQISTTQFGVFAGLGYLSFVYLGGITTVFGAVIGGVLAAGGLVPEFTKLHFDAVSDEYIVLVGAIGLVLNAILTRGEGIALLQTDQYRHILSGLRGRPSEPRAPQAELIVPARALAGESA